MFVRFLLAVEDNPTKLSAITGVQFLKNTDDRKVKFYKMWKGH